MELGRIEARFRKDAANDVTRARDARIARALDAIAANPARAWTVAELAKIAGMSRAVFARRFVAEAGVPPLAWVTRARIARSAELLVAGDVGLAAVAADVGYANEFALSRAFRRHVGEPPGVYRRRVRAGGAFAPRCIAA
jgi:transcriptional regulator GlxA family with amidase domain